MEVMELVVIATAPVAGYCAALLTVLTREHHRQRRIANATSQLPPGSRYIENAGGIVVEIGSRPDGRPEVKGEGGIATGLEHPHRAGARSA